MPPVSRRNRSCNLVSICSSDKTTTRAAASSIASGIPSRRRQIRAIVPAFSDVARNDGSMALARSRKSRVPSASTSASTRRDAVSSGSESEGMRVTVSPGTPSASRLVTTIRRSGTPRSSVSASSAQASIRCSQLSSTSRSLRWRRLSRSASRIDRCGASRTPTAVATVSAIRSGVARGARSASHTASGAFVDDVIRQAHGQTRLSRAPGARQRHQPR